MSYLYHMEIPENWGAGGKLGCRASSTAPTFRKRI